METKMENKTTTRGKRKNPVVKEVKRATSPFTRLYVSLIRSVNSLLKTLFNIILLLTQPAKLLVRIVQFIKSKIANLLFLLIASYFIIKSSMEYLPIIVKEIYPSWSTEAISSYAWRLSVFSEIVLIVLKLKKKKFWSFVVMLLVLFFSIGGLGYDIIKNIESYSMNQLFMIIMLSGAPTLISIILLWTSGTDVSKISMYPDFDKNFKPKKKSGRRVLSGEDKSKLIKEILEHVDYYYQTERAKLSFNSIQQVFKDRVGATRTIQNILKEHRPAIYSWIAENQSKGRKREPAFIQPEPKERTNNGGFMKKASSWFQNFIQKGDQSI